RRAEFAMKVVGTRSFPQEATTTGRITLRKVLASTTNVVYAAAAARNNTGQPQPEAKSRWGINMALAEDIAFVGSLLDAYAPRASDMGVASQDPQDAGVPPEMQVGEVNGDGWVEWRMLPSTLSEPDVAKLEEEFAIRFPPLFRAYLLARFHLF